MLQDLKQVRERPMDILISIDNVPIIRFPSYKEALTAMAGYLAMGHPVESILLTQLHDGEPKDEQKCQSRATLEGGSAQAY
jgi:hypothetical protein